MSSIVTRTRMRINIHGRKASSSFMTQRLGGSGGMPPRKYLNCRHSEIDSGAFWDAFSAGQGIWMHIQIEVGTAICTRRTIDRFSGKLRRKGLADPNPLCASTRGCYLIIIIIHKTRKNRGGNCLLCLKVATPLHSTAYTVLPILSYSYYIHTFVLHTLYVIFCIPSCMHTPVISCVLVRISSSPLTVCMYVCEVRDSVHTKSTGPLSPVTLHIQSTCVCVCVFTVIVNTHFAFNILLQYIHVFSYQTTINLPSSCSCS